MTDNLQIRALPIGQIQSRNPEPPSESTPLKETNPAITDGCHYSDTCFKCPLPRCRHEYTGTHPPRLKSLLQAIQINEQDMDIQDIMKRWSMSGRNALRLRDLADSLPAVEHDFPSTIPTH